MTQSMPAGIFSGVRVIELAQYVFVPGAGVLLADQGAEVIKIELTGTGDPYRGMKVGDGREIGSINLAMEQNNHGKKSIALNLKTEEGREALLKLAESADVFLSSLRPKALKALRLEAHDLRARNPKIIYARGNGLGFKGAEADKAGYDASAFWARGGMGHSLTRPGQQPTAPRPALGDHSGSMAIAYGIAGALFKRAMTGEPSVVEISLLSTAVWMLSSDITYSQVPGYSVHGAEKTRVAMRFAYRTSDGRIVQLMLLNPQPYWRALCELVGLQDYIDDPRFAENDARMANSDALIALIQDRIGAHDWAYWQPRFEAWDAPWELIRSIEDVVADPQVAANDMIYPLQVGDRTIKVVAGPVQFDGRAVLPGMVASPAMGAHTDALLAEAGYSPAALADLKARGIAQ
jgi:crotonobetainyl-CoA:carnitine CoA-transferase CaiB-like acyl-CoA transferase